MRLLEHVLFISLGAAPVWAASTGDASFEFKSFTRSASLKLVGSARIEGNGLRLTPAAVNKAGAVWYASREPIAKGFDTSFHFQLTGQGGLGDGADGFAFVMQNAGLTGIGSPGSAGGFAMGDRSYRGRKGVPRAIAVFFDTFRNVDGGDPSDNFLSLCSNGGPRDMHWPPPRIAVQPDLHVTLKDGRVHRVRIRFKPPVLSVFVDDMENPAMVSAVDLSLVTDAAGSSFIGFTASTGAGFENHDILDWSFTATDASSALVSSSISFIMESCLPGKSLCTPEKAVIDSKGEGKFHIVLPAHLAWGASVPNPGGRQAVISDAKGSVCWDLKAHGSDGCSGPDGNTAAAREAGLLAPDKPAGALIVRTDAGRTAFSVNDVAGTSFADNEGFYEFDVELK